MEISSVTISNDLTSISLVIEDAADLQALRFWNDATWKDYTEVIDLGGKLTGATTEYITVSLSDINEDYFDGIYFFETEDSNETSVGYVAYLVRFEECILEKIRKISICDDCLNTVQTQSQNARMLLDCLYGAIEGRFIDEMLNIKSTLDKFCSSACQTCGDYGNIKEIAGANATFDPIRIKIDGGKLD